MSSELWVGTTNKGKVSEISLLAERELPGWTIKDLRQIPSYMQPPENGQSFLENARIKARSLRAMKPGLWCMAEDSGLEVPGLGNLPGIHSARYAGPKASDSENVAKLLKMLQIRNVLDRQAKFVCSLVAYDPEGQEHIFTGECKGVISKTPQGLHGFGYDPVFIPEGQSETLAQLGVGFKNSHSHRSQATRKFFELIKKTSPANSITESS